MERPGRDLVLRFAWVLIGLIKTSYFCDLSGHLLGGPNLFCNFDYRYRFLIKIGHGAGQGKRLNSHVAPSGWYAVLMRKPQRESKFNRFLGRLGEVVSDVFFDGGARGPLWVRFVLFWEPSGLPLGAFGSIFAVRRILHFIQGFVLFSATRVLSWLSWPPSGCLGPVPLALRGRSEGPASLAHGIAFSVFWVNDAFFPRPSFFKPPRVLAS